MVLNVFLMVAFDDQVLEEIKLALGYRTFANQIWENILSYAFCIMIYDWTLSVNTKKSSIFVTKIVYQDHVFCDIVYKS